VAKTFPPGFRWGVATSGHQTEGGNTRSDTWFLEHVRPTVFRETSGKACNGYELWREDVDLVAALGLDAYRLPALDADGTTSSGSSATTSGTGCTRSTGRRFVRRPRPSAAVYSAIARASAVGSR